MTLGLLSLISIATPAPTLDAETKALSIAEWEALWTKVLSRHVDASGRIDFDALSRSHADLDQIVAFIAETDPESQPQLFPDKQSRLAFYVNAYNALAMYGVIAAGVPENLGGFTKFTPVIEPGDRASKGLGTVVCIAGYHAVGSIMDGGLNVLGNRLQVLR